ncbi:MAG: DUF4239 domain-containing protein [Actinobacteria bacterium]|nr:DUF4239 domain-containing protein [Actinomycetota bacterium]
MNDSVHAVIQWPLSVTVSIAVTLSIVVPLLTVWLFRRKWPYPTFKENNELIGFTYAVYGMIYGVLLAFTIIVGWEGFAATEELVMDETTILSELWRDSEPFPPAIRESIHNDLNAYARSVIDDEWPAMAERGEASPQTQAIYESLWTHTYDIHPETENQKAYLDEYLARMNELSGDRRLRVLHSTEEVPSVLLLVLLVGGVTTVAYTLLFSNKHVWVQVVIMGSIMLIVMLGLLVTLSLQHPFSGGVSIEPEAFEELLDSFRLRMAAPVQ